MCSSLSLRYRQTPLRERGHEHFSLTPDRYAIDTAFTFKRKQIMLNPPSLIWRIFKDRIRNAFLAYAFSLESKCKSTHFSATGQTYFQRAIQVQRGMAEMMMSSRTWRHPARMTLFDNGKGFGLHVGSKLKL